MLRRSARPPLSQRSAGLTLRAMDCTMIECLKTSPKPKTDRRALTALEYALIAGVLALAVLAVSTILSNGIDSSFSSVADML
jgi:Flp pilus assembly pilin Flp